MGIGSCLGDPVLPDCGVRCVPISVGLVLGDVGWGEVVSRCKPTH